MQGIVIQYGKDRLDNRAFADKGADLRLHCF